MKKVRWIWLGLVLTPSAWGESATEVFYVSAADDSVQPAMFYNPETDQPVPLVVALHTWSGTYKQTHHQAIEFWCVKRGWAYIHPDFRGPNKRPEGTGSKLVVEDIVSAVAFAKREAKIDVKEIYLVGTSGGGHACLVMAGKHPEIWAGISAWVPISDLTAWYNQGKYRPDLVKSCGGVPGASEAVDAEYRKRSPITYLANAKGVTLHINAGIFDGHKGSVPVSHSLLAFNEVAEPKDRIAQADIDFMVKEAKVPQHLGNPEPDPSYGKKQPLFRRNSGPATVTIFDGGHELIAPAAIAWFESRHASRGNP